ncbi:MAG: hypothetical protein HUK02_01930 [Bacteroidaceae bacterium]|nr:hypothetical protein [Bacteroidaceae bacterium]
MKQITFILFLLVTLGATAGNKDDARKVLDATAAHLQQAGGMTLQFTATQLRGTAPVESQSGTLILQGKKFQMTTPEMLTWFDGKTQWTKLADDNEVNMTEPTDAELQAINPYLFLSVYKKGFKYKLANGELSNGQQGYKVYLTATSKKQEIQGIFLEVDQQYNPVRVSMRQGKDQWVRIVITSFKSGQHHADTRFKFPSKDFPTAQIIDLR